MTEDPLSSLKGQRAAGDAPAKALPPDFKTEISVEEGRWLEAVPSLKALARDVVAEVLGTPAAWQRFVAPSSLPANGLEVGLCFAGDDFVHGLNKRFRGKDCPTNVLSFPSGETFQDRLHLGDITLASDVVFSEAEAQEKEILQHVAHLLVHGLLHLLGHDHENEQQAREMETLEAAILKRLGYPDPYAAGNEG